MYVFHTEIVFVHKCMKKGGKQASFVCSTMHVRNVEKQKAPDGANTKLCMTLL